MDYCETNKLMSFQLDTMRSKDIYHVLIYLLIQLLLVLNLQLCCFPKCRVSES